MRPLPVAPLRLPVPLDRLVLTAAAFTAGLGLGLLVAPGAGEQTRRRLSDGARGAAAGVGQQARGVAEAGAQRAREAGRGLAERHVPLQGPWDVVDGKDLLRDLPGLPRS